MAAICSCQRSVTSRSSGSAAGHWLGPSRMSHAWSDCVIAGRSAPMSICSRQS